MFVHMLKFVFFHACIDMTSREVVTFSSNDELIFGRNLRLLREHDEQEERHNIQKHLSRVLEEVKKGKRKFLRIAAFTKPSDIPVAIPPE